MKLTTNINSLPRRVGALSLAALLMSHAMASPSLETVSMNSARAAEPRRSFDAEKEMFVPNPNYREPAVVRQKARTAHPAPEPRRIFDAEKKRFVRNPAYYQPVATVQARPRAGEPRRIFDAEKERFVPNPDYRGPAVVKQAAHRATPAVRKTPVPIPRSTISGRTVPSLPGDGHHLAGR